MPNTSASSKVSHQVVAPGLILETWGAQGALTVSASLSLIALGALLALRRGAG